MIPCVAVETVAKQKDPMKRVRDARREPASENILILGDQGGDPEFVGSRGYPSPKKGEFLSIPAED